MNKIILIFIAAAIFSACKNGDNKTSPDANNSSADTLSAEQKQKAITDSSNFTTIQWLDSTTKNLGKLVKDQSIEITFRFKNTGTKNLIFESVTAGCGCTIPEKPEKPFAPGEEGLIKAKYDGRGEGAISKQIYVKVNTTPAIDHTLTFTGDVQKN